MCQEKILNKKNLHLWKSFQSFNLKDYLERDLNPHGREATRFWV